MSEGWKHVSFEEALVVLKRDVLLVDVSALFDWLAEYMDMICGFRVDGNLKREQEAIIMYNVVKDELAHRGLFVEEFGDFSVK